MNHVLKPAFLLSPLALAMSLPLSAQAELLNPDTATDLDTVTVSADFRQTDVQSIPEAVTVVTDTQIEQRSAEHLEQILSFAPNVNFSSGSSRGRYFQIRGIGERSQFIDPVNPSVGLMIDGIDMTGLGGAATLLDIEQVEILRGPQGTRFGANALAGMINIQSKAPTKETEGFVAAKAGNYGTHGQSGAISGGLTDNVQGRLAVSSFKTDGYMENDFLDKENTNNIDEVVLRGKLAAQLSEQTDLNFTYFYTDIDNGYDAFSLDNDRTTYSDQPGVDAQESHSFALTLNSELSDAVLLEATLATTKADVEYSYDEDWAFGQYDDDTGNCLVDLGPCLATQESAFGYSSFDQYLRDYKRHSLDLRLLSGANGRIFADTTDWVVGLYVLQRDEELTRNYTFDSQYQSDLTATSYSVYTEFTTNLSADSRIIYGVRGEQWRNDFDNTLATDSDETENLFGGKITFESLLTLEHLAYASIARGYKPGGANSSNVISEDNRVFDTEFNNTLEFGLKSSLLDDQLTTRVAAFVIQRKDQQVKQSFVSQRDDGSFKFTDFIANAAEGRNQGIELESSWQLHSALRWDVSLGYLDTEFVDYEFNARDEDDPQRIIDQDGRAQAHAPEYSYATAFHVQATDRVSLILEAEGKDEFYFSDSHDEQSKPYTLWHARLAYTDGPFQASVYGRNLTDQDQEVRGFSFPNDPRDGYSNSRWTQLGEPRLIGIEGKYSF